MPHLMGLKDVSGEQITHLLDQAESMQEVLARPVPKVPVLRGLRVALMFFENSTRTRMSFELAAKSLSADVLNFSSGTSSLSKGETLLDTAKTIEALGAHCVVVRDRHSGMPAFLAKHLSIPVVNAGDGINEHPTQALLDLLVLKRAWGDFAGRTLAIVGDVARSRVARSHLWAAPKLGHRVRVVAPATFVEPGIEQTFGVSVTHDLQTGITGADAVMLLRVQKERQVGGGPYIPSDFDYFLRYGLTRQRLRDWAPHAVVLHPGPVNRAVEIAPDLIYGDSSLIQEQVTTGVALRMAVLYWALGGNSGGQA